MSLPRTVLDERWAALALGAILVVAGLYQLTPLKQACLRRCRSPVAFLAARWLWRRRQW